MSERITQNKADSSFEVIGSLTHDSHYCAHMKSTSTSIIEGVQKGDDTSQAKFMRRYLDPCCSYYIAKNGWNFERDTADQLAKKVLYKLVYDYKLRTYNHIPGKTRFRAYLFRALYNGAVDQLREDNTNPLARAVRIKESESEIPDMPFDDLRPEERIQSEKAFIIQRRRSIIGDAIEQVKIRERDNNPAKGVSMPFNVDILMEMIEGRTSPDIAKKYKLTEDAVRGRATTARKHIKEEIIKHFSEEGMLSDEIEDEIIDLLDI